MTLSAAQQADLVLVRLRKAGFNVIADTMTPRPWTFTPNAVLLHHTASTSITSVENEKGDVRYIKSDEPDWPAPHAQWYVGRTGRIYLLTRGGANHAGTGTLAAHGIPANLGNQFMWGIENQSAGLKEDWTDDEWASCAALAGELCMVMGVTADRVWRHKDYSTVGKVDTVYPLDQHRRAIGKYIDNSQKKEDEVTKDDLDKIQAMIEQTVAANIDTIADAAAKSLLGTDLYQKSDAKTQTVRAALRVSGKE